MYLVTFNHLGSFERRIQRLTDLLTAAERRRTDLDCVMAGGAHSRETEKHLEQWDRRYTLLRNMKTGLEQMSKFLQWIF